MMADSFDPYLKWLGIKPKDQPPHHYRLLGINLYEDDPDIIQNTADQRMVHLRTFQSGKRAHLTQRLLNEVAAAKVCLLNSDRKAAYDAELRQRLGTDPQPRPRAAAPRAKPKGMAAEIPSSAIDFTPKKSARPAPRDREKPAWLQPAMLAGIAVTVLLLLIVIVVAATRNGPVPVITADGGDLPKEPVDEKPVDQGPVINKAVGNKQDKKTGTRGTDPTSVAPPIPEDPVRDPPGATTKHVAGKTVDLLGLIDPARDAVTGDWRLENGSLVSPAGHLVRLQIPGQPPPEYRIDVIAQRREPNGLLGIGLKAGNSQFLAALDSGGGSFSGLSLVDGQPSNSNQTTSRGSNFADGQPHSIAVTVRASGVQVVCDGRAIIDWTGDWRRLRASPDWSVPNKDCLFLVCGPSSITIRSMTITPLGLGEDSLPPGSSGPRGIEEPVDIGPEVARAPVRGSAAPPEGARPEGPPVKESSGRLSVPDDAEQERAEDQIKEIYDDDFSAATTPERQLMLASRLLDLGRRTKDDSTARYVLLRLAMEMATSAGDFETLQTAVDAVAGAYDIDALQLKSAGLAEIARSIRGVGFQEKNRRLVESASRLAEEAVDADNYGVAKQLGKIALTAARKGRDVPRTKDTVLRNKEIDEIAAAFASARQAFSVLESKPDDPDANLLCGRFFCFAKGDWASGLPLLALSSDESVKSLAAADLLGATSPDQQAQLGNGWWQLAETSSGIAETHIRLRAAHWYHAAARKLTGADQAVAEQRLNAVAGLRTNRAVSRSLLERIGVSATVYWLMADTMDIYHNGKPLRRYQPGFKTRGDEARETQAYSARIVLRPGDVFTVGGRRGGSYGGTVVVVDENNQLLWCSNTTDWRVYEPAVSDTWFLPDVALQSIRGPVKFAVSYGYQAQMRRNYGGKPQPIWGNPSQRFVYMVGVYGLPGPSGE